ncbi:hypothetical protein AB0K52_20360 [Glycomyces sp. NPDC049804]|uniref:hypothetical protein n=1 Tax=Glycomyces sp. NPDC049804 TaxID=3154363 RepID=UPI003435C170
MVDDLAEWGFAESGPEHWAHIARRGNASVYLNEVTGVVAATSADEIMAGAKQLRVLASDLLEFFDRFALGPEYPVIDQDPKLTSVYSGDAEGWLGMLESAGCVDPRALRRSYASSTS